MFAKAIYLFKDKGKMLAMIIALLPTGIYMASHYSYDGWVIAFTVLGYALISDGIIAKEKISLNKYCLAAFYIILGIIPKAAYVFMVVPLLFISKDKFEQQKNLK